MTRPTKAYVDAALAEARCDPDADHVMPRDEALDTLAAEVVALREENALLKGRAEIARQLLADEKTRLADAVADAVALREDMDAAGEQDITINQLQHELECVRKVCNDTRARCYPHGRAAVPRWVIDIEHALGEPPP